MFEPSRLPAPDEMGFFIHPDIPGENEDDDVRQMLKDMGFNVGVVSMEDDAPDLADEWFEEGNPTSSWVPTPPDGTGWQLVAVYDTEDGVYAMFVAAIV